MAKLRKWCAYRTIERPYTRWSKVRKKAFVKSRPGKKVIKFDMGNLKQGTSVFPVCLQLKSRHFANIRSNALESARTTALKRLEANLGRTGFYFKIKVHPHHVIRENPLAAGAGADRLSTGMKHSFGKTIATAARVEEGQTVLEVHVMSEHEAVARDALKVAGKKLPLKSTIQMTVHKVREMTEEELLEQKIDEAKQNIKDGAKELEDAQNKLKHAENDEDKAKAEAAIKAAESKIESSKHLVEVEEEQLHEVEEKHAHEEEAEKKE